MSERAAEMDVGRGIAYFEATSSGNDEYNFSVIRGETREPDILLRHARSRADFSPGSRRLLLHGERLAVFDTESGALNDVGGAAGLARDRTSFTWDPAGEQLLLGGPIGETVRVGIFSYRVATRETIQLGAVRASELGLMRWSREGSYVYGELKGPDRFVRFPVNPEHWTTDPITREEFLKADLVWPEDIYDGSTTVPDPDGWKAVCNDSHTLRLIRGEETRLLVRKPWWKGLGDFGAARQGPYRPFWLREFKAIGYSYRGRIEIVDRASGRELFQRAGELPICIGCPH